MNTPVDSAGRAVGVALCLLLPLMAGLAVLGGAGSFATIKAMAQPWFGDAAWIVPIGVDLGILALLGWDLLLEHLGMPWPLLRWIAWAFIAATVYLNTAAAHGDPIGMVIHAAMPLLFVTALEGARHLIRHHAGLAAGTHIQSIPRSRWLLAPIATLLLRRRMILWHVTGYRDALRHEHLHLTDIARLQQQYGRWTWRWSAPLEARLAVRLHPIARALHSEADPPNTLGVPAIAGPDAEPAPKETLLEAARAVTADARHRGVHLTQTALGRQLRAQGYRLANGRLRALAAELAQEEPAREQRA